MFHVELGIHRRNTEGPYRVLRGDCDQSPTVPAYIPIIVAIPTEQRVSQLKTIGMFAPLHE